MQHVNTEAMQGEEVGRRRAGHVANELHNVIEDVRRKKVDSE